MREWVEKSRTRSAILVSQKHNQAAGITGITMRMAIVQALTGASMFGARADMLSISITGLQMGE